MRFLSKYWNIIVSSISMIMALIVLIAKDDPALFWSLIIISWISGNAHKLDMIEEKIDKINNKQDEQ